jgi:methyl-accepting chemotaxis protein
MRDSSGDNFANVTCPFGDDMYPRLTFTEGMLSHTGDIDCEFHIYENAGANNHDSDGSDGSDEDSNVTTFSFVLEVKESLISRSRLITSNEFDVLNDLITQALAIPDLINDFNLSQEQFNQLILNINNQFDSWKSEYSDFSTEMQNLIDDARDYLNSITTAEELRVAAENARVDAENKRQEDTVNTINDIEQRTATAIKNSEIAISKTNDALQAAETATENANNAADEATNQALYAKEQGDRVDAALIDLQYKLLVLDGGDFTMSPDDYTDIYDGGEF